MQEFDDQTTQKSSLQRPRSVLTPARGNNDIKILVLVIFAAFALFWIVTPTSSQNQTGTDGPADQGTVAVREDGNAASGREVFRFETFGNEGFWTDAVRVPKGVVDAKVTPLMALKLGMSVDVDALDAATKQAVAGELRADPTGVKSKLFNDPKTTLALLNANAIIGFVVKDTNNDGKLDLAGGDKLGVSCASCHTITDGAVLKVPNGGSIRPPYGRDDQPQSKYRGHICDRRKLEGFISDTSAFIKGEQGQDPRPRTERVDRKVERERCRCISFKSKLLSGRHV